MTTEGVGNLVISRRRGQAIYIGRGVIVTVVEIGYDDDGRPQVRLAIEAPRSLAVSRDDFTLEQHHEFQRERESGRAPRRET